MITTIRADDGLTTQTADRPGRVFAGLTFGLAARDESPTTRGISRLLGQIVWQRLQPRRLSGRLLQDDLGLTFEVSGTSQEVAQHLAEIATVIHGLENLTEAEVARAARIAELSAEESVLLGSTAVPYWFGMAGPGLETLPPVEEFDVRLVAEWARRGLVADNAVISATGPLPEGFSCRLPVREAGRVGVRRRPERPRVTPTTVVEASAPVSSLAILIPSADHAYAIGRAVLEELHNRLVIERPLVDRVEIIYSTATPEESFVSFSVVGPGDEAANVLALRSALEDVARGGVSQDALALAASSLGAVRDAGSSALAQDLFSMAGSLVAGLPVQSIAAESRVAEDLDSDRVAAVVAAALERGFVLEYAGPDGDELAAALGAVVDPRQLLRPVAPAALSRRERRAGWRFTGGKGSRDDLRVVLTGETLFTVSERLVSGRVLSDLFVGFDAGDVLTIFDQEGSALTFDADDWRDGPGLIEALRRSLS
ncbi:hypothetical protein [Frondihabitans peucedani]|uniref:Insulinase family protein n=1 Tax=Frondihabitans peucedani TaxID=598626 RepID=A0ABP8E569_9MICO